MGDTRVSCLHMFSYAISFRIVYLKGERGVQNHDTLHHIKHHSFKYLTGIHKIISVSNVLQRNGGIMAPCINKNITCLHCLNVLYASLLSIGSFEGNGPKVATHCIMQTLQFLIAHMVYN